MTHIGDEPLYYTSSLETGSLSLQNTWLGTLYHTYARQLSAPGEAQASTILRLISVRTVVNPSFDYEIKDICVARVSASKWEKL